MIILLENTEEQLLMNLIDCYLIFETVLTEANSGEYDIKPSRKSLKSYI